MTQKESRYEDAHITSPEEVVLTLPDVAGESPRSRVVCDSDHPVSLERPDVAGESPRSRVVCDGDHPVSLERPDVAGESPRSRVVCDGDHPVSLERDESIEWQVFAEPSTSTASIRHRLFENSVSIQPQR
jgi:hypothetical protein